MVNKYKSVPTLEPQDICTVMFEKLSLPQRDHMVRLLDEVPYLENLDDVHDAFLEALGVMTNETLTERRVERQARKIAFDAAQSPYDKEADAILLERGWASRREACPTDLYMDSWELSGVHHGVTRTATILCMTQSTFDVNCDDRGPGNSHRQTFTSLARLVAALPKMERWVGATSRSSHPSSLYKKRT
ncbi:hypothetical protein [Plantibacter sp. CFBP 8804]|uniref:hypothetical protein n=1 Tax=Plantibacter sp. CFBP 8804 TaxID=2775270 RepID=UPI0017818466|nr:hypothetical protein [Plantibacter sp. CFBP 8804]MBD8518869.1 hypothetical protein [Plantibacter sp. CFBP 8804]